MSRWTHPVSPSPGPVSRDDDRRPQDLVDTHALLQVATELDVATCRQALRLITGRGFNRNRDLAAVPLTTETLRTADCVAILTDHRAFDYDAVVAHARLVVDARNAIKRPHPHVFKLGGGRTHSASERME